VVTHGISEITENGVTTNGVLHEADAIVYGTGFAATEFLAPMKIRGVGGHDLHDDWAEGARAYYGMTVPHFPNLFLMYAPNTNTGGGSIVFFLEVQAAYLRQYDDLVASGAPITVKPDVEQTYDETTQGRLRDSVCSACSPWHRSANGRITTNWPYLGIAYKQKAKFRAEDYDVVS